MARPRTKGKCTLCGKLFPKSSMGRHLIACRAKHPPEHKSKAEPALLIVVAGEYLSEYWMFLEARKTATLGDLDDLLRRVWLECCEHLSEFQIGIRRFSSTGETTGDDRAVLSKLRSKGKPSLDDMLAVLDRINEEARAAGHAFDVPLGKVLSEGTSFTHVYDFGSSTCLVGKAIAEYEASFQKKEAIRILARNDPPDHRCGRCGKPARIIRLYAQDEDEAYSCKACCMPETADNTKDDWDMGSDLMPLVNSPRAGVCAYGFDVQDE